MARPAYAEPRTDQTADSVVAFMRQAIRFYAQHGIQIRRLMTDNAWAYTKSKDLRKLLAEHTIKHLRTKPYRPRTNGKIERFHQRYDQQDLNRSIWLEIDLGGVAERSNAAALKAAGQSLRLSRGFESHPRR